MLDPLAISHRLVSTLVYSISLSIIKGGTTQVALINSDLQVRFLAQAETERNTFLKRITRESSTELSELKSQKQ